MSDRRAQRRLAAIVSADVVGYSRMMGADEEGTLARLNALRTEFLHPKISEYGGRIVKLMGDGTLIEFPSAVDAVQHAVDVQRMLAAKNAELPQTERIQIRIGVNLGDVLVEGDDIYGDGVNVAARLEPLAEPGGVCVASIIAESVGGRVPILFADAGEVLVKNIERPIRIWKWHPELEPTGNQEHPTPLSKPVTSLPSIAVLPFTNMSGDPEQEYFSDGISEDIITDLSKVGGLIVIARNSTFAYKGTSTDVRKIGRELGVKSVLEGSIRRAGNRVRITAQLIDASAGGHLWAERYDRELTDIFAVQDEVTQSIVEALKITLSPGERARIVDNPTDSIQAHDLFLKGREVIQAPDINKGKFEQAIDHFTHAIELDPNFAQAYAFLAYAHVFDFNNSWTDASDSAMQRADELAYKAIELDDDDPMSHAIAALAAWYLHDSERAKTAIDKALALNPNLAFALNVRGAFEIFGGQPEVGIPDVERAMRLDPGFAQQYLHYLGFAHFLLGKYETAALMFNERILLVPKTDVSRWLLASALGHLDRFDEARRVWSDLKEINAEFSSDEHFSRLPFRRQEDMDRITGGLAKAGLTD